LADREQRIQAALRAYEGTGWGRAVQDTAHAKGLCKRASLVLLELLHRHCISDARLVFLGKAKLESEFAPTDEHYVVRIDNEGIDATARQFDPTGDAVTRRPMAEVVSPWQVVDEVEPGILHPPFATDPHGIPANWRDLADVDPPGDAIGWEYPGGWPTA
jgi:hypothetical protein